MTPNFFFLLCLQSANGIPGKWSDCSFVVGSENSQGGPQTLACHKIILSMASPVFEAMFYGSFSDSAKNEPIVIVDVQADAFKALLEYIYTDKININNVDKAFDLCYAAKKYMLPYVVDQCTRFLWSDLQAKNACRAYEFSMLFEEQELKERSLQIICTKTKDVIQDQSFEEVELSTIITILDQDALNVDSELTLFFALNRFAEKHGLRHDNLEGNGQSPEENAAGESQPEAAPAEQESIDMEEEAGPSNRVNVVVAPTQAVPQLQQQQQQQQAQRVQDLPTIRDAVKKIRFLTLTPQQFAEGPARTNLLSQSEAFAILMNISTPNSIYPMIEGFTMNKNPRVPSVCESRSPSPAIQSADVPPQMHSMAVSVPPPAPAPNGEQQHMQQQFQHVPMPTVSPNFFLFSSIRERRLSVGDNRYYCIHTIQQMGEIFNRSVLDSSFTFSTDRNVSIYGLQICTQVNKSSNNAERYSEILYAHLLDGHGSRLTYTHSNQRVQYESVSEILFDRPVFIQSNKVYKIGVVFNKVGYYQEYGVHSSVRMPNITFSFNTGNPTDTIREGLIRSIIFG